MKTIGLGTAAIGRPQYINIRQDSEEVSTLDEFRHKGWQVLESAYAQGVRYFDTAPGYGMAERLLIEWAGTKTEDASIEIATKWGYSYVANFDLNAQGHEIKDHSLSKLNEQWQNSQALLPNLSTLQVHSATFESGILQDEEVLNRLAELKSDHNLLIGITTSGNNQIEVLRFALEICIDGIPLFDVFQVTFNVLDQSLSAIVYDLRQRGKRIVIKEALANGRLFRHPHYPQYNLLYDALEQLADKYQVGVDAIALRFCQDSINPYVVLSGAASPYQIKENLKVHGFQLNEEELTLLKSLRIDPEVYWSERKQLIWN